MENNFKIEIISPEKVIFSDTASMVTIPSYEGEMGLLKDHISIITFLKPGVIKVNKDNNTIEKFFVEDGTVEFFKNNLVILSASVINIKNISKNFVDQLNKDAENRLAKDNITDHDRFILNHKIEILKELRI